MSEERLNIILNIVNYLHKHVGLHYNEHSHYHMARLRKYVEILEKHGVYKQTDWMRENRRDSLAMVSMYGAWWHCYTEPLNCPKCNADFRDLVNGPPFMRVFTNGSGYGCPFCKHYWKLT